VSNERRRDMQTIWTEKDSGKAAIKKKNIHYPRNEGQNQRARRDVRRVQRGRNGKITNEKTKTKRPYKGECR